MNTFLLMLEETGYFNASLYSPFGIAGVETLGYEIAMQCREQLGKDPSTVSKWCSNTTQPPLDMLVNIAKLLEVDIKELINEKSIN